MIVHGARIGFFQGDIRRLSDDLNTLKPTVFPVVPRLLNRMYDKVGAHADGSLSAALHLLFEATQYKTEDDKGVCVCVDLWAGQYLSEALGAGIRLQEEGGRDAERHRQERQYLGPAHLQEGPGTEK